MAILRGFPPSNTISPTIHITERDFVSGPSYDMRKVQPIPNKTLYEKNPWLKRRWLRETLNRSFWVTSRVVMPERVPDKSKMPRFMSSGE